MGTIDEISRMKSEGRSETEIISYLKSSGVPDKDIENSMSQAMIKEAVSAETEDIKKAPIINDNKEAEKIGRVMGKTTDSEENQYLGMQPSMLSTSSEEMPEQQNQDYYQPQEQYVAPEPSIYGEQPQQEAYPAVAEYNTQYQAYQPSELSSDTITEISEQIVDEKILSVKNQMEKVLDFKNTAESKMEYIDERLKRIEKIIDRLQLSILQKVGDYMTNIEDIKREVIETQKSFTSLSRPVKNSSQEQRPTSMHERSSDKK